MRYANKTHSAARTYDVSVRHVTIYIEIKKILKKRISDIIRLIFLTAPYVDFSVTIRPQFFSTFD